MKIYSNRLIKGILYTLLSLFFIFHEYSKNLIFSSSWKDYIMSHNQGDFSYKFFYFIIIFLTIVSLIFLFKGIYYLCTCHIERMPQIDVSFRQMMKKPVSGYDYADSNIEKIASYRNSKLSSMNNEEASNEYLKTAWLDGIGNGNYKHTNSIKRYINSKLSSKTNEQGYQWIKRG